MIADIHATSEGEGIRLIAANDMTSYIYRMQEYIHTLSHRGDFGGDGRRLLDMIIGEMEHERTALVEAALDTWV